MSGVPVVGLVGVEVGDVAAARDRLVAPHDPAGPASRTTGHDPDAP